MYMNAGLCHDSKVLFFYHAAPMHLYVEAVFSCLIPGGLFDSEPLYKNSNRTQEGVSGWEAEIITVVLFNMHHENLWWQSQNFTSHVMKG